MQVINMELTSLKAFGKVIMTLKMLRDSGLLRSFHHHYANHHWSVVVEYVG